MAATVIYDGKASQVAGASARGNDLWMPLEDLATVTGWELKPQGLCRDDVCVPIPAGRESEFIRENRVNLAALARMLRQPTAHDDVNAVWFFGESVGKRRDDLLSLKAPDFALPDLDGRIHRLSEYAGRKVLLLSWASW